MTTEERKIREVGLLSTSCRTFGGKGSRSIHYKTQELPQENHGGGVNFMSSSSHGNTASDWASSPQSPPRSEISVVNRVCKT